MYEHTKPMMNKAKEVAVLVATANNLHGGTQHTSHGSGISHTIVIQILHHHRFHLYTL
jgi:hypothetical protein